MATYRQLRELDVSHNQRVTDASLKIIGGLKGLRDLNLSYTKISDAGLEHLAPLPKLERLLLLQTSVSDAGVRHLVALRQLTYLAFNGTKITAKGREMLKKGLPKVRLNW